MREMIIQFGELALKCIVEAGGALLVSALMLCKFIIGAIAAILVTLI